MSLSSSSSTDFLELELNLVPFKKELSQPFVSSIVKIKQGLRGRSKSAHASPTGPRGEPLRRPAVGQHCRCPLRTPDRLQHALAFESGQHQQRPRRIAHYQGTTFIKLLQGLSVTVTHYSYSERFWSQKESSYTRNRRIG